VHVTAEDDADLEEAVDLVRREMDAEVIDPDDGKKVRGALVSPRRTGPKMGGPPPATRRRPNRG
jgi:hypothetical protein